jgi:hypothetical protein
VASHLPARWFAELISSTLKMEAICSSETLVETLWTTRRHIPEDATLHHHHCENLKSYIVLLLFPLTTRGIDIAYVFTFTACFGLMGTSSGMSGLTNIPEDGHIGPKHVVNVKNVWYICTTNCVDGNNNCLIHKITLR